MNQNLTETTRDEDLVAFYLKGDPEAFPILYQKYQHGLFLLVRSFFPVRERAEEVFQEVFMKLVERMQSFDSSGSFKSWLYTLCRNHCIDRIRHQKRRPEQPESDWRSDEEAPTPLDRARDTSVAADTETYDRELAAHLHKAHTNLPQEQRE